MISWLLIRQIPNLISLLRLVLVPIALYALANREYGQALIWCAIGGISDAADGFLARRLKATSKTGAYLDPLADKLLLSGAYLVLGLNGTIPWWLTAVVFGRDVLMLLALAWAVLFTTLRSFPPTLWGKLSTIIQIITMLWIILSGVVVFGAAGEMLRNVLIGATVAATAWSAVHYCFVGVRMVKQARTTANGAAN